MDADAMRQMMKLLVEEALVPAVKQITEQQHKQHQQLLEQQNMFMTSMLSKVSRLENLIDRMVVSSAGAQDFPALPSPSQPAHPIAASPTYKGTLINAQSTTANTGNLCSGLTPSATVIVTSPPPSGATTPTLAQMAPVQTAAVIPLHEAADRRRRARTLMMWLRRDSDAAQQPDTKLSPSLNKALTDLGYPPLPEDAVIRVEPRATKRHTHVNALFAVHFKREDDMHMVIAARSQLLKHYDVMVKPDLTPAQEASRQVYLDIIKQHNDDKDFTTHWGLGEHPTFCVKGVFRVAHTHEAAVTILQNAPARASSYRKRPAPPSRLGRDDPHTTADSVEDDTMQHDMPSLEQQQDQLLQQPPADSSQHRAGTSMDHSGSDATNE